MKKTAIMFCAVAAIVAMTASHSAIAGGDNNGKKAKKINICHNGKLVSTHVIRCLKQKCKKTHVWVITTQGKVETFVGKVINVNANAAQAHYNHGDQNAHPSLSVGDKCKYRVVTKCIGKCVPRKKLPPKEMEQEKEAEQAPAK